MRTLGETYSFRNRIKMSDGPIWDQHEWHDRYEEGEATFEELKMHEREMGRQLDVVGVIQETQNKVAKRIKRVKKIDISAVPEYLRKLTIYRTRLKENRACVRVVVRPNQDWLKEGKVVVELVDKNGRVIDDIIED